MTTIQANAATVTTISVLLISAVMFLHAMVNMPAPELVARMVALTGLTSLFWN
jgi:hypothetical protein